MIGPPRPPTPEEIAAMKAAMQPPAQQQQKLNTAAPDINQWQANQVQAKIDALRGMETNYSPERAIQNFMVAREQPTLEALQAGGPPSLDAWAKAQSMFPNAQQTAPGKPDVQVYPGYNDFGNPTSYKAPEGYDPYHYETGFDQGKGEYRTYFDYPEYEQTWQGYGVDAPDLEDYVKPSDRRMGTLATAYGKYDGKLSAPFGNNMATRHWGKYGGNALETLDAIKNKNYADALRQYLTDEAERQGREIDSLIERREWMAQANAG
jgi:hypothetical protein